MATHPVLGGPGSPPTRTPGSPGTRPPWDFGQAPMLIAWELTRACALKCRHCRATAIPARNAGELSLAEISRVLEEVADLRPHRPIMIFTGGDPTERPDLSEILARSVSLGLVTAVSPSVTPRLTDDVIAGWTRAGVHTVSISIDGPTAEVHDHFRGVPGTFEASLAAARSVVAHGLPLQVNTSVSAETPGSLESMAALVRDLGARRWELFFVIGTGRARDLPALSAEATESALVWLARHAPTAPYRITTVAAPQFRRVREELAGPGQRPEGPAVKEGRGFAFIDHLGNVAPNGYLPLAAGNVRGESFSAIYRESPLFRVLRDASQLRGRCGRCPFREVCGGSRARAYAVTGDILAEDPACPFRPEMAAT